MKYELGHRIDIWTITERSLNELIEFYVTNPIDNMRLTVDSAMARIDYFVHTNIIERTQ